MERNIRVFLMFSALAFVVLACQKDEIDSGSSLDNQLKDLLITASEGQGLGFFTLPASDDFARIPQDPKNPLSQAKVELGRNLYHETGLAIDPVRPEGKLTYSCASCHHSRAGFQAGRQQGIRRRWSRIWPQW